PSSGRIQEFWRSCCDCGGAHLVWGGQIQPGTRTPHRPGLAALLSRWFPWRLVDHKIRCLVDHKIRCLLDQGTDGPGRGGRSVLGAGRSSQDPDHRTDRASPLSEPLVSLVLGVRTRSDGSMWLEKGEERELSLNTTQVLAQRGPRKPWVWRCSQPWRTAGPCSLPDSLMADDDDRLEAETEAGGAVTAATAGFLPGGSCADETATAPDVVHASQAPLGEGLGEGEAGGVVLQDGGDALVAKATPGAAEGVGHT
ncbi:hypothetical protein CRUP_003527, partial [Coryphaenoides rupestris]